MLRRLAWLPVLLMPLAAQAQRFEGPVAGTLDCPARSLFESGSTQVRGTVRNGQMSVGLGQVTVTGRIIEIGPQPAVRLEGSAGNARASFDGLVVGSNQFHARGILNEQPCNLNLTLSVPAAPPGRQAAQAQPARGLPSLDGPWAGSVVCPLRDLSGDDRIAARGSMVDNVLTVDFASVRVQGRVAGISPRPALRLEGGGARGVGAGFDATSVTANRIEARGMVGGQPCTISLTRGGAAPPPVQAAPLPSPPSQAAIPGKPAPSSQAAPPVASSVEKPAPSNAAREAEPPRAPPVATVTPRPQPAPPPAPAPTPAPTPRAPSGAADQLACALAGTCPTPTPR